MRSGSLKTSFKSSFTFMKTPRWFTRNRFSSHLRIATAVTLTSAPAAMAFVAVNNSSPLLSGNSAGKGEAELEVRSMRNKALADHFKPLIGRAKSTARTAPTIYSGRTTAVAVAPNCTESSCTVFIGAAGGGVWKTTNALAATPTWSQVSDGQIPSNAIGSIVFDSNDATFHTLYVGTGEPNGSSDSEAGVGLYESADGGSTWTLVSGSTALTAPCAANPASLTCPVATDRSICAIA